MARARKRGRIRASTAPKVSRKMAGVRPLQGKPGMARGYDPGFKAARNGDPWRDEGRGEPEVNG